MFMVKSNAVASTFPFVVNSTTGFTDTAVGAISPTMPSGAGAGDLLLVFTANGIAQTTSTTSTGWTRIADSSSSTGPGLSIFAGISGTATATPSLTYFSTTHNSWASVIVRGWTGSISDIKVGTVVSAFATVIDPPALTPATGNRNYLWISQGNWPGGAAPSAGPTGYTTLAESHCSTTVSSSHAELSLYYKQLAGTTQDPGSYTPGGGGTQYCLAETISIPGP